MITIPNKNKPQEKTYQKLNNGLLLVKYTVVDIKDFSNKPGSEDITIGKKDCVPELCLLVRFNTGKFEVEKYFFGNYLWDVDKVSGKQLKCIGWQIKKNKVYDLLCELSDEEIKLNDDYTINENYLNSLIGNSLYFIKYPTDGGLRDFWGFKKAEEKNIVELINLFNKYKPKDYIYAKATREEQNEEDII